MEDKEIWERLTKAEQAVKSINHRIDNIEKLTQSVYTLATEVRAMRSDLDDARTDIADLQDKPAKRYEAIVDNIIKVGISGVIGYIVAKLFGGN